MAFYLIKNVDERLISFHDRLREREIEREGSPCKKPPVKRR